MKARAGLYHDGSRVANSGARIKYLCSVSRVLFFIVISFILFSSHCYGQTAADIYRKANLNYENGNFKKAAALYEALIKADRVAPEVYYNLGNAYFKLKDVGRAILNYKRALRLAPRDRDIVRNLNLARTMCVDKVKRPDRGFLLGLLLFPYFAFSLNELTHLTSVFYIITLLFLLIAVFLTHRRRALIYFIGTSTALFLISLIFLASKIHDERFVTEGVVVAEKVDVRSGPRDDYLLQFTLHAGAEVRVLSNRGKWYEIALSRDLKGWVREDTVDTL